MLLTEGNIDIWYKYYTDQFKRSVKNVKRLKGETRGLDMLTREEFGDDFTAEALDNPRMSGTVLAEKMARADVYVATQKQAVKQAEAYSRLEGVPVTPALINKFRAGAMPDFFLRVETRRQELKSTGFSNAYVKLLIGQEFFDSEGGE